MEDEPVKRNQVLFWRFCAQELCVAVLHVVDAKVSQQEEVEQGSSLVLKA